MADLERHDEQKYIDKDTNNSPESERETTVKQDESVHTSAAFTDSEVNEDDVNVLPGTGGPDDFGDIDVKDDDLNL